MILHAFVGMSICSNILYIIANITLRRSGIKNLAQTPLDSFSNTTQKANDPTCVCLTEYLQPYISPNVFTFPSMAVCVFWIYGKGEYLRHQQRGFGQTNNPVFCYTLICDMTWSHHLWTVNMFYLKNIYQSKFNSDDHQFWQTWTDLVTWTSLNRILGWSKNHRGPKNVIWKKTFIWSCE